MCAVSRARIGHTPMLREEGKLLQEACRRPNGELDGDGE
jgi:hypothetical protein